MNMSVLLRSNLALRAVSIWMGTLGLLNGITQLKHGRPGFAAFTCVLAVYYLRRSKSNESTLPPLSWFDTALMKRTSLLFFGISLGEFCIIEIMTHVAVLADNVIFAYIMIVLFFCTFMICWVCASVVAFRYFRDKLSGW